MRQYWKHRWHGYLTWWRGLHPNGWLQLLGALMMLLIGLAVLMPTMLKLEGQLQQAELNNGQLLQQKLQLDQQRVTLELELKLEQQSQQETKAALMRQRQQLDDLETELAFYRSIMAPETIVDGVVVHDLALEPSNDLHRLRYDLVLTQQKVRKRYAKGQVSLVLEGSLDGKPVALGLSQLGGEEDRQDYSFRYFKQFQGELLLPTGFVPERATVRLRQKGGKGNSETHYPMTQLLDSASLLALQTQAVKELTQSVATE